MQFGIIATHLDTLIPPDLSPQEGLKRIVEFNQVEIIKDLVKIGFNPIEIGLDLGLFLPHIYSQEAIKKLVDLKEEIGVSYTVHLPLWSVEPSSPLQHVRYGSVKAMIESIKLTEPLQPEFYVLHSTGELAAEFHRSGLPVIAKNFTMQQFHDCARESVNLILEETDIPSRKIAVETIEFPFELTHSLAEEYNLSMCLDTGHVLIGLSGPIDVFEALDSCLPRLGEIHLHDGLKQNADGHIMFGSDHQTLGRGDLDVGRFLDKLEEANYSGPIIFELSKSEAIESIENIRKIRPDMING